MKIKIILSTVVVLAITIVGVIPAVAGPITAQVMVNPNNSNVFSLVWKNIDSDDFHVSWVLADPTDPNAMNEIISTGNMVLDTGTNSSIDVNENASAGTIDFDRTGGTPGPFDLQVFFIDTAMSGVFDITWYQTRKIGEIPIEIEDTRGKYKNRRGDIKVPEPGTMALLSFSLAGLGFVARRRRIG